MTEENEEKPTPFDAEWEFRKVSRRILDIMDIIDELKAKDKSLSARISRLKLQGLEELDEPENDLDPGARVDIGRQLEGMSLEERALLAARLIEMREPSL